MKTALFLMLFGCSSAHAQYLTDSDPKEDLTRRNDFIVLTNQDTITGKISLMKHTWELAVKSALSIQTSTGTLSIMQDKISEYKVANQVYMYVSIPDKKGKHTLHRFIVIEDGAFRLLLQMSGLGERYLVYHQNTFHELIKRHFSDEVWNILMQCPSFNQKHGGFKELHLERQWEISSAFEEKWKEMLRYYNRSCVER